MNYHVYIDRKPSGTPFYVGIGNAARVKCVQRNAWHRAIRLKYPNWTRKVVETAERKLCEEFEEFLISEIGRRELGTGPLVNFTAGGEGASATIVHADTRSKMSAAGKGRVKTEEWRAKISAAHIGKVVSEETCRKISKAKLGAKMPESHSINTSKAVVARWKDPEYAKKMRGVSQANWDNPDWAARTKASQREAQQNPELKKLHKENSTRIWSNPMLKKEASARVSATVWVTDGSIIKRVLPKNIPEGWRRGRK